VANFKSHVAHVPFPLQKGKIGPLVIWMQGEKEYPSAKIRPIYCIKERTMPIVNSVYKAKKLFVSEFFCPNCFVFQPYELKPISQAIAFCPISFVGTNEPDHVIECKVCKKAFDPEILTRHIQSLLKLVCAAEYQLDHGIPPGYLKLQLVSDGLKESFADRL
jgi:hypothetical protein